MVTTVLFDLDGTLLPIDTAQFVRQYMKALAAHAGHLVPPQLLVGQVMASTAAMINNMDPTLTNAQVFSADFFPKVGREESELMPVFVAFYRERFPALKAVCPGLPGPARDVVRLAVDRGYEIALATNPLFPRIAIEERMRWAGIDEMPWRLVTSYEEMHACKPHQAYYSEVLDRLGRLPEQCLMVGNDVEEDGAAEKLGISVHFITDYLINPRQRPVSADRSSTLLDFRDRLAAGL